MNYDKKNYMGKFRIFFIVCISGILNSCNNSFFLHSQNNKQKGTYTTIWEYNPIVDSKTSSIGVKLYELDNGACNKIDGKIEINGKSFIAVDSTNYIDKDGLKDYGNYFHIDLAPGNYTVKAIVNNKYYSVKTEIQNLKARDAITLRFYLIRKDLLKKKS